MRLIIDFDDILRATLDEESGNEGYIGINPNGLGYHVVVPVDRQIARGIKAGNRPLDETPFGGYKEWHYFCCSGYNRPDIFNEEEIRKRRLKQARTNALLLQTWAVRLGIEVEIKSGRPEGS
ncbi:MAG: hypothetical protein HY879_26420 [Deltaproteobacteria bacterium]|nr:hypothetical protein [Deltaproteobacteria bacterium]